MVWVSGLDFLRDKKIFKNSTTFTWISLISSQFSSILGASWWFQPPLFVVKQPKKNPYQGGRSSDRNGPWMGPTKKNGRFWIHGWKSGVIWYPEIISGVITAPTYFTGFLRGPLWRCRFFLKKKWLKPPAFESHFEHRIFRTGFQMRIQVFPGRQIILMRLGWWFVGKAGIYDFHFWIIWIMLGEKNVLDCKIVDG